MAGLPQLFEKFFDLVEFFLDRQCFGNSKRCYAEEVVFSRHLVNLIFFAEPFDQTYQVPREGCPVVTDGVPDPLELIDLFVAHRGLECFAKPSRRPGRFDLIMKIVVRQFLDRLCFVTFQDLPFALQEHGDEGVDARAKTADLARVDVNGPGKFFVRQPPRMAKPQHMIEGAGDDVRRRLGRTGELPRVVLLIRMDDSARFEVGHDTRFRK